MADREQEEQGPGRKAGKPPAKRRISMHEGIGDWCDCCPCEAEPRWVEVGEELGIDLGDYEDEAPPDEKRGKAP